MDSEDMNMEETSRDKEEFEDMLSEEGEEDDEIKSDDDEEDSDEDENEKDVVDKVFVPGGEDQVEEGEEMVMDENAYIVYHQAHLGPPCLSFDVIPDGETTRNENDYPLTMYGVAGTQAAKVNANSLIVFKMFNLHPLQKKVKDGENDDDDDDEDEDEEEKDPEKQPKLKIASIKHNGCINRVRYRAIGSATVAAAWSETGSVGIWNLSNCLKKIEEPNQGKEWYRETAKPLYNFTGHLTEGYAVNWSPTMDGVLATGDCKKNIHIWKPAEAGTWSVDQRPLMGHSASVEDILWSPNEQNVLASCSVDKSIRVWDCRAKPDQACMLTVKDSHESDVNVIDWNENEPFIASGGDDGFLKIWDLRQLAKGVPVASFKHHTGPVTSVEWHHSDATVLATSGADDQIALWDLAIEKDDERESNIAQNPELSDLPPQLLFIHQGLTDIKEIHWHKQMPGLILSTSHSGFDVFRTISV